MFHRNVRESDDPDDIGIDVVLRGSARDGWRREAA